MKLISCHILSYQHLFYCRYLNPSTLNFSFTTPSVHRSSTTFFVSLQIYFCCPKTCYRRPVSYHLHGKSSATNAPPTSSVFLWIHASFPWGTYRRRVLYLTMSSDEFSQTNPHISDYFLLSLNIICTANAYVSRIS